MNGVDLVETFINEHQEQLENYNVPRLFWNVLCNKLHNRIFDSGQIFHLVKLIYINVEKPSVAPVWQLCTKSDINIEDPNHIYLIDHAWTYENQAARLYLTKASGLLNRMCNLMGIDIQQEEAIKIECVLSEMWRYNQALMIKDKEERRNDKAVWYIMDEVGSAINHSSDPNFRVVPFFYMPENITYSLLFPIKDVKKNCEITRDYVEGLTNDPLVRSALELPWISKSFENESFEQQEPEAEYFKPEIVDSLPINTNTPMLMRINSEQKFKIYSEFETVDIYLTDSLFDIVESDEEADILWFDEHFYDYAELSTVRPHVFINQFPFEHVLTMKNLLPIVCRSQTKEKSYDPITLETYPLWLPTTYNLNTELVPFISYYMHRENRNMDNHWICKPHNLSRGMDTYITKDLHCIVRLINTGPKIIQKYVVRPVLYDRPEIGLVKFDIRYIVLLKSVAPLCVFVYKDFFLRFANLPFAMNNLDVYEQHFTVMNYCPSTLFHLKCADFIVEWERQYPRYPWETYVEPKILSMLREVFEAAIAQPPPKGIAANPQSRALYAVDLILEKNNDDEIQPKLLEFNFMPDLKRACEYYPTFINDVFRCLFLDGQCSKTFHVINR